jgi:predicted  nucleic acid-binding Zn-ribbon protein
MDRREFIQSSTLAAAGALLGNTFMRSNAVSADTCTARLPSDTLAPDSYTQQPGLLALRADGLLHQIYKGYGFYGQPRNWTTLWSLSEFATSIGSILHNDMEIAASLDSLACATDVLMKAVASYDSGISAAQQVQAQLKTDIDDYSEKAKEHLALIDNLKTDIAAQRSIVDEAEIHFDQAVLLAATVGCGISQILSVVSAVVSVVGAVATAGSSLVTAYAAVGSITTAGLTTATTSANAFQQLKAAYDQAKPIVSKVETAINDVNDIKTKYDKLKVPLETDPDSARVVVEKVGFDKLSADRLATFDNNINNATGVAQSVKDELTGAVHRYFHLVQQRNTAINGYDALVVNIRTAACKVYEQEAQIHALSDLKSRWVNKNQLPQKLTYVAAMDSIQAAQLDVMRRLVWEEKRAQAFWQLNPAIISDSSLVDICRINLATDLLQAHTGILTQQAKYDQRESPTVVQFDKTGVPVILSLATRKSLVSSRRLRFIVRPQDGRYPSSMREIFVTGFKITTNPQSPEFSGRLAHLGRHEFETVTGKIVEFLSQPTYLVIQSGQMSEFKDFTGSGSQKIRGLSAFGDWVIFADDAVTLDTLTRLQSLTVHFFGFSRASTQ